MFCPKCNYTSFDHLPTCPKCAYDWSQQKEIFNMEWMVPTATEGMNIFTPVSPESLAPTGQSETPPPGPGYQTADTDTGMSDVLSQTPSAAGTEEEIEIDEADFQDVQGEAAAAPTEAEHDTGQESPVEVDDEINFEGLQDFFTNLTEEGESASPEASESALQEQEQGSGEEPDLEIEVDDQSPEAEEKAPSADTTEDETMSVDQDDLDLDITSILDDIESDSEDKSSGDKKRS